MKRKEIQVAKAKWGTPKINIKKSVQYLKKDVNTKFLER